MFFRICKILFDQKIFSVLNKKTRLLDSSKLMSETAQKNIGQKISQFFTNEARNYCRNFMENQKSLPIPWENLEQSLKTMKSTNFRSTILKSCQILENGDLALDYCEYIVNKGEKLSLIETCLFIKAVAECKNDLKKYDKLIKTVFDYSHETIFDLELVVKQAVEVFCQNKSCFQELLLKYKEGKLHTAGIEKLIATAFDINEPELAWKMANENPEKCLNLVFESYLKFCIRMAEKNKFSIDMIDNLVNFTKTHKKVLRCDKLYDYIYQLTVLLNKSETKDYLWSVNKCDLGNTTLCSSCQYKFKPETVTVEELEELKKNFLEKVIICYNVNMKTTPKELENFLIFLENCKPYDIVIDVLNLFNGPNHKKALGRKALSYFENQGMRMLLIARHHFRNSELYNEVKEKCQIFLTRNDSLDDLFCLYAAMHQGLNTFFCTSDFLRDHARYFDGSALNTLFHKWQISHQYMLQMNEKTMLHPRRHSDMSQSSVVLDKNNKVKEYVWHLSYLKYGQQYRVETPADWVCFIARSVTITKESSLKEKKLTCK